MTQRDDHGLILMPDISGYTAFVHHADAEHAQAIVTGLLEALIAADRLDLRLCDIEGDALFFFRAGELPDFHRIVGQVAEWDRAFHLKRRELRSRMDCGCGACERLGALTLKVVAHYGQVHVQKIGHLSKLFGGDVILAHRLLKNDLPMHSYFLFTDTLADRCEQGVGTRYGCVRHEEEYPVFGRTMLNVIPLPVSAGMESTAADSSVVQPDYGPTKEGRHVP